MFATLTTTTFNLNKHICLTQTTSVFMQKRHFALFIATKQDTLDLPSKEAEIQNNAAD